MNDLSASDIILFGVLVGALVVTLLGLLWAMAYQGRKRWSAECRGEIIRLGQASITEP